MSVDFIDGKGDCHDKSSVREGETFKEKEYAFRRSTFNVEKERLASPEMNEDDIEAQKKREHQSEEERRSSLIEDDLIGDNVVACVLCKKRKWSCR